MAEKRNKGFVYFARFADTVKIGFTTNLPQRLKGLERQTKINGHYLGRIAAPIHAARFLERWLHLRCQEWRIHDEWFAADPALLAFIQTLIKTPDAAKAELQFGYRVRRQQAAYQPAHDNFAVIARIASESVINSYAFEAEMADALKQKCAQLGIAYDTETIARALRCAIGRDGNRVPA